jgi:hypothetical protein
MQQATLGDRYRLMDKLGDGGMAKSSGATSR